ncbi:MAG TPA: potassium-transporting ATPase subunit KdpC [Pirellulales bacterium]|nr:potassium-transporting ATPase subunit KdpC [Pirellulales bacterium]
MFRQLRPAALMLLVMTLVTGVAYPLLITGLAQVVFPREANGSLILDDSGKPIGSELIGQPFDAPEYFWGRLSATSPTPYTAFNKEKLTGSSGSNLGPLNPALIANAQARIDALKAADPDNEQRIPVDLITSSGSGLDPHISPAAAKYQSRRVARARKISESQVERLIAENTQGRTFGALGEPRVNVLKLNLALDRLTKHSR